ncbi:MAG: 50S ribosomal protein L10 [Lachnospiraceae bacterium]|nr:50S ribosomal protein L10 [Lachnospiraceae bacterium]
MAKVELKQPVVDEIAGKIKDAKAAILVDYRGLTVEQDTVLRKQLREAGVVYKVYKNTMMKRAFEGTDFAQLDPHLDGPSALALATDDVTAPARILAKFAEKAKVLEMKGGVVEGNYYDAAALTELAKVPSREELLSRLLGSMQSPITNFARVIKQIAEKKAEGGDVAPAEAAPAEAPAEAAPAESPAEATAAEAAPAE